MRADMRLVYGFIIVLLCNAPAQQTSSTLAELDSAQKGLQAEPESEARHLALAALYLKAGQNRAAIELLKSFTKSHRDAPKALRLLAVAYLREDNFNEANAAAEQARGLLPDDPATLQVLAMAQLGLGASDTAERLFRQVLQRDPNAAEANLQLGLLFAKQHRNMAEAIRLLEKARDLQPSLGGTYAALGSAYLESGQPQKAAMSLEAAIKLSPSDAQSHYILASAYRQLQQTAKADAALAAFNALKKSDSEDRAREMRSRADYEEGVNLLSHTEELDKAYAFLSKAAVARPSFDPAYYRMAQVSYLKGDLPRALTEIRQALSLNPLEPEYYYVLARCLQDSDRPAALAAIEKARRFRPGVPDFEELFNELKGRVP